SNPKYAPLLQSTRAAAVLVSPDVEGDSDSWIRVKNPFYAMARVVSRWFDERPMPRGISPLASNDPSARLGSNVGIGPFVTIAANVVIEDDVAVFQHVSIEAGSTIGSGTIIYPTVSIYERT